MCSLSYPLGRDDAARLVHEATDFALRVQSMRTVARDAHTVLVAGPADAPFSPWDERRPCSFCMGAFDGVHLGHRALVRSCVEHARAAGALSCAVLFDPDPSRVLAPDCPEPELTPVADRALLMLGLGLDAVAILRFDDAVAATPYDLFMTRDLAAIAPVESLHVGADFRLGQGGAGDVGALGRLGQDQGFSVLGMELLEVDGAPVTASRIRALLATGDIAGASRLLGRCPLVRGTVAHGRGEGTGLGFSTANVIPGPYVCLPADGVYGCFVRVGGDAWPAAVNVGRPRSFELPEGSPKRLLEAHLVGFSHDLYGAEVEVVFIEWLRAPRVFSSVAELEQVVGANVAWVAQNLGTRRLEVGS